MMALPRQKRNWDQHAALLFMENLNMMVPYYLMASYAYYKQDDPIFSDAFFDNMGKTMLERWEDIAHFHKEYINKGDLEAGTYLGKYPTRVEGALRSLRNV
jgi:predicted ATP-dependent Lon-type protease|tara:strand:- start:351 stop:653 length:303 start_codon:yes stop_codon:yes gene_type:complete